MTIFHFLLLEKPMTDNEYLLYGLFCLAIGIVSFSFFIRDPPKIKDRTIGAIPMSILLIVAGIFFLIKYLNHFFN
jgi:di/tricarboxylate transporter